MARSKGQVAVQVETSTIKVGDVITVGGLLITVRDLFDLPGGGKRIGFGGCVTLTLPPGTPLTALRTAKGW
jgi:hypothetical protein